MLLFSGPLHLLWCKHLAILKYFFIVFQDEPFSLNTSYFICESKQEKTICPKADEKTDSGFMKRWNFSLHGDVVCCKRFSGIILILMNLTL